MKKKIAILGSTGSIGKITLNIIQQNKFRVSNQVFKPITPRELVGDFVSLFGTADPELLDHEGKSFMDRGVRRVVDVHGHSLSLYTGAGTRRHTAHDIIVRKLESILKFAGQHDIVAEDADVFKWCIRSEARRRRYAMAMGARNTRRDATGIRPDLSAQRYRFARSAMGPSQHQLWDVKTVGVSDAYHANFRVPPADQRAASNCTS